MSIEEKIREIVGMIDTGNKYEVIIDRDSAYEGAIAPYNLLVSKITDLLQSREKLAFEAGREENEEEFQHGMFEVKYDSFTDYQKSKEYSE